MKSTTSGLSMLLTPFLVKGVSSIAQLSLGTGHTCASTSEGSVWCWGDRSVGQLGLQGPQSLLELLNRNQVVPEYRPIVRALERQSAQPLAVQLAPRALADREHEPASQQELPHALARPAEVLLRVFATPTQSAVSPTTNVATTGGSW